MSDDIQMRNAGMDSPEFAEVLKLADAMRDAIADDFDWTDPTTTAKAITAAAVFAGMMFGQMIAVGLARPGDKRRAGEMVLTNFRTGTDAGFRQASRVAREIGDEGVIQ